jgi:hypothetical protein
MDNVQGPDSITAEDAYDYSAIEAPPVIGAAERRMHVRAYNYWVSLLGSRSFPSIEDLAPEDVADFGPNSVLLDFSMGIEDPAIIYLGAALRDQCGIAGHVERTSQVPPRSLLTRLTDHYLQIIANAAPVGFEAEFTNQRGSEILYRGILMPFSSDDETIDFIYGVVSWKELASQNEIDALGLEMAQALQLNPSATPAAATPSTAVWADSPSATTDLPDIDFPRGVYEDDEEMSGSVEAEDTAPPEEEILLLDDEAMIAIDEFDDILDLTEQAAPEAAEDDFGFDQTPDPVAVSATIPEVSEIDPVSEAQSALEELDLSTFAMNEEIPMILDEIEPDSAIDLGDQLDDGEADDAQDEIEDELMLDDTYDLETSEDDVLALLDADMLDVSEQDDVTPALAPVEQDGATLEIGDILDLREADDDLAHALDLARQSATEAREADARSRAALYRAIGHAYDFAIAARNRPDDYAELLERTGIVAHERAPMTAIIKLVFGADYDKTRIAEYALALDFAFEQGIPRGALARELAFYAGGLKGLVRDVRAIRNEGGAPQPTRRVERARKKLQKAHPIAFTALPVDELGMTVVVARLEPDGSLSVLGALPTSDKVAQQAMIAVTQTN